MEKRNINIRIAPVGTRSLSGTLKTLFELCLKANVKELERLLEQGADINVKDEVDKLKQKEE